MKRKIITIDQDLCNGCGLCIPNCPEGAMKIIDGKARLISDLFCDGLGACIGNCPTGALTMEEREAEVYDERKVMSNIVKQGDNVIKAHLEHLRDHGETGYYNDAIAFLEELGMKIDAIERRDSESAGVPHACPGSRMLDLHDDGRAVNDEDDGKKRKSHLATWPVQLHLVSPQAPYFRNTDVLFAADCTAFALADFHKDYLKGKSLIIACPKLDSNKDVYIEKLVALFDEARISSLTVMIMEVPCCGGLVYMVEEALKKSQRKIPFTAIKVSLRGEILSEEEAGA